MAIISIYCPVVGAQISRMTDFEGVATRIICAEYETSSGSCRLKKASTTGGPLEQLLQRVSQGTLSNRSTLCHLRT
jgi:hypothetical protein